jgi:hypothetical protein
MACAGIRKTSTGRYFDARGLARDFRNELLAQVAADSWTDPRRGRILFDEWADHSWQLWSSSPRRSPKDMETTKSHLRCHLRPSFGPPAAPPDHPRSCCAGDLAHAADPDPPHQAVPSLGAERADRSNLSASRRMPSGEDYAANQAPNPADSTIQQLARRAPMSALSP